MAGQQQFVPETWEGFGNVDKAAIAAAGAGGQADLAAEVLPFAGVAGLANAAAATTSTAVAAAAVDVVAAAVVSLVGGNPTAGGA